MVGVGAGGPHGGILVVRRGGVMSVWHWVGVDWCNNKGGSGESDESPNRANCSGGGVGVWAWEWEKRDLDRGSSSKSEASFQKKI
jgi:hypothetical protein